MPITYVIYMSKFMVKIGLVHFFTTKFFPELCTYSHLPNVYLYVPYYALHVRPHYS